jgi:hypothetical protein
MGYVVAFLCGVVVGVLWLIAGTLIAFSRD